MSAIKNMQHLVTESSSAANLLRNVINAWVPEHCRAAMLDHVKHLVAAIDNIDLDAENITRPARYFRTGTDANYTPEQCDRANAMMAALLLSWDDEDGQDSQLVSRANDLANDAL